MNPLGLAAPALVVDRLALSQLVTDAFAGLPLPERYALAWVLSPVFSARNRLTSATSELLAKPVAPVLAFAEGGERAIFFPGVRPSPAVTASGWPTRARVKGPRHGPSAGCTRSGTLGLGAEPLPRPRREAEGHALGDVRAAGGPARYVGDGGVGGDGQGLGAVWTDGPSGCSGSFGGEAGTDAAGVEPYEQVVREVACGVQATSMGPGAESGRSLGPPSAEATARVGL